MRRWVLGLALLGALGCDEADDSSASEGSDGATSAASTDADGDEDGDGNEDVSGADQDRTGISNAPSERTDGTDSSETVTSTTDDEQAPSGPAPAAPIVVSESCVEPSPAFSESERMLVELPADTWFEVEDSKLEGVCPEGLNNCGNVVAPWSSGVFDGVHQQMLVFGGGHGDYAGNEVYAFPLETLEWSRLTDPSDSEHSNQDPLPDGRPVSRHTYDGLSFVTHAGKMFAHGGSRWQDGSGTDVSWAFDPETGQWEDRQPASDPETPNCCGEGSAYDPKSKRVYFHLIQSLVAYDYDANEWQELADYGNAPFWPRYEAWGYKRGLVDTKRDLLWFIGGDLFLVYDIAADEHVTDEWVTSGGAEFTNDEQVGDRAEQLITTGGGEVITAPAPGTDYDPVTDHIVAWVGGAPWLLDLTNKTWTRSTADGGPAEASPHGTYGRFRYVPRVNAFVLVNGSAENVWVYKHSAGCGE